MANLIAAILSFVAVVVNIPLLPGKLAIVGIAVCAPLGIINLLMWLSFPSRKTAETAENAQ